VVKLSELMASLQPGAGSADLDVVGEDWMQGRSAFGGLQAAVLLRAMRTLVADMPLRTLQMTFIAPVGAQGLQARARVLRSGKNTAHVEARFVAGDETLAIAIAVFGTRRDSIVRRDLAPAAALAAKSKFPYIPGVVPSFMQHFDVTLLDGALPFSNTRIDRMNFQVGMHDSGRTSEAHLLAMADFVPPVALAWMATSVPASSLTWMLEVLDDFTEQPLQGWRVDAQMVTARDGYTSQSTTIYAPDGRAIALSRQSMVVFA